MDPFSHFLLGYLLGYGIWGPSGLQYVVAAALAGGLPDADVALYPLSHRFPLLRHRGISHSIVGVTILAAVGTFVVPWALAAAFGSGFAAGIPWAYFVSLEVGGLSHVLLDAMDHWSVPIFAPFSKREYGFDADRIANLGAMSFTVGAYAAMLYERGRTPLWVWEVTAWLLLAGVLVFFAVRLAARWRIEAPRKQGRFSSVVPQFNPFRFLLYSEEVVAPEKLRIRFVEYDLLRGKPLPEGTIEAWTDDRPGREVRTAADAIAVSYASALKKSWFLVETNRFARVRVTKTGFEVFWYSLELSFWGRSAGVLAEVETANGGVTVRSAWRDPQDFGV
ncbi:MAG TPA: metal-dependent hydrolase [Thermoplasmata archaeon]|nr:metal-dependent hydrolase [Thermoplasmata archaeon]